MMKHLLFLFCFLPAVVFAQFTSDFEDGDISSWTQSNTGRWAASSVSPLSGDFSLHHIFDNPDAGNDQIAKKLPSIDITTQDVTWRFSLKHTYNPSSSNHWGVFLISDANAYQMYPGGAVNGYAAGVNLSGYDDTLRLWKLTNGTVSEVIKTTINWQEDIGTSMAPAIEIIRSTHGDWEFKINPEGNFNNTYSIGKGHDSEYTFTDFFGVFYNYSSAQDMKLWVDDIYFGAEIKDTIPPQISTIDITDSSTLQIRFTETIDAAVAVNPDNYFVNNNMGNPETVMMNEIQNVIELIFDNQFTNETYHSINIANIADPAGNILADTTIQFLYFLTGPHHVVINEIMADPNPPVNSLPNEEYIELYNTTNFAVDLTSWKLISGRSTRDFPAYILEPNSYVTLCSETAADELSQYGPVLAFSSFSNIITNSGTTVKIINNKEVVIDSVEYTIDWYHNPDKENGGWSLEKIDPLNFCSGYTNWKASVHNQGGTPGFKNSVFASNQDTSPPQVERLEVLSSQQLRIYFNEPLKSSIAENINNYVVNQGIGNPYSVFLHKMDRVIDLLFLHHFPEQKALNVSLQNITDWCGHVMPTTTIHFNYYVEKPYDIVINEIMANPEPVVFLPEFEYIEILNTTAYTITLTGWTISAGSSEKEIPASIIEPGEYIILCDTDASTELQNYGKTIAISGFPSLTNSGQKVLLKHYDGTIISGIIYSDLWYQNEYKAEGGWSLEQIDPFNPCGGGNNWKASNHENGGTPGQINSVDSDNPDIEPPEMLRAALTDEKTVQLFFSESIHPETALSNENYWVNQGAGHPKTVDIITPQNKSVLLNFEQSFESNTTYQVEVTGDITDCAGNIIRGKTTATFAVAKVPEPQDVVINEILFNPFAGGVDFVEIYNRSDKTFDLTRLRIASYDNEINEYKNVAKASDEGHLIFPGEYKVITESPEIIKEQYYTQNPDDFAEVSTLPSFNNDKGQAIIMDKSENTIDVFSYTEDMHFPLLASKKGVSLERINYERPTDDGSNWHSASEVAGFATPAYENSQFNAPLNVKDKVSIDPEIFSPDNDGYQDVTTIIFNTDEPGYVAHIKIFDSRGRLIKYLANNLLLGINQTITWDGLDDKNQKAPMGVYVVFIELFDLEGNVKQYKKSVVVASKL